MIQLALVLGWRLVRRRYDCGGICVALDNIGNLFRRVRANVPVDARKHLCRRRVLVES